ncbi:P-loop NTPase [uncultured Croceicoccus sp.]|uniref:tyrosine-protein kinase family protein n=1 Tax=uncultured Croceicoccus sp. TaxID=1295329 RepID=UPI002603550A|nr:P-loop NTPase [uncultured Croceicoccus sp.]
MTDTPAKDGPHYGSANEAIADEGSHTGLADAIAAQGGMASAERNFTAPNKGGENVDWDRLEYVSDEIVVLKDPMSARAADLRRLAQKLAVQWFLGDEVRCALSIISADRGEGRTTVATNLACVFAQAGARTLLIDADLYNPTVHRNLGVEEVSQEMAGNPVPTSLRNLFALSCSKDLGLDHDLFMRSTMSMLIETHKKNFDLILVDTNAASISDDYLFAALSTGGAVVATREGVTKVKSAARMLNRCEDAGVRIVGGTMLKK